MTAKVQLIKEEIEKQKSFYQKTFDVLHPDDLDATIAYANIELLNRLLQFIDSLPEEPVSEDLDFLVSSLEETIGTSPHSREVIKEHLQKAAEWQKQQMIEKALAYLNNKFYFNNLFYGVVSTDFNSMEEMFDDFRKAMEE